MRLLRILYRHTSDIPRVRIVMPLSRECRAMEYRAVGQRLSWKGLARCLSFECSYKPNQFMFRLVLWVLLVGLCRGKVVLLILRSILA